MNNIIKLAHLILGSVFVLSSCSQDDVSPATDPSDRRILFHTSLPEVTSRASGITTNLEYFHLTVFDESDDKLISGGKINEYIDCLQINRSADSNSYISDDCVWPAPGQESDKLHFFAYYPALSKDAYLFNATEAASKTVEYQVKDFSVAPGIADQMDFVTAYASGSMADNMFSGISLKFRHQLSRIEVNVKGSHKSCDIEIAGVRIANACMQGTYVFPTDTIDGTWTDTSKGNAEYIFSEGDTIVTVVAEEKSILSSKLVEGYVNCAILIPSTYSAWDYTNDAANVGRGMYLNVLLRIIDKTPTKGNGKQQYPYFDNSQGLNALNIPRVYIAVANGVVTKHLYKNGNNYFTDEDYTQPYNLSTGEVVKEFGWAALPISADWKPGHTYTYTLDYSSGIGLHGPDVKGNVSPKAGDPIISDRVGVSVSVNYWQGLNGSTTHKVEVPGS